MHFFPRLLLKFGRERDPAKLLDCCKFAFLASDTGEY
jgi:hypothetical protein